MSDNPWAAIVSGALGFVAALVVRRADTKEKTTSALRDERLKRHSVVMEDARRLASISMEWALGYFDNDTGSVEYPKVLPDSDRITSTARELDLLSPWRVRRSLGEVEECARKTSSVLHEARDQRAEKLGGLCEAYPTDNEPELTSAELDVIDDCRKEYEQAFSAHQDRLRTALEKYAVAVRREMGVNWWQSREHRRLDEAGESISAWCRRLVSSKGNNPPPDLASGPVNALGQTGAAQNVKNSR